MYMEQELSFLIEDVWMSFLYVSVSLYNVFFANRFKTFELKLVFSLGIVMFQIPANLGFVQKLGF